MITKCGKKGKEMCQVSDRWFFLRAYPYVDFSKFYVPFVGIKHQHKIFLISGGHVRKQNLSSEKLNRDFSF
jgi:hypothetical protein